MRKSMLDLIVQLVRSTFSHCKPAISPGRKPIRAPSTICTCTLDQLFRLKLRGRGRVKRTSSSFATSSTSGMSSRFGSVPGTITGLFVERAYPEPAIGYRKIEHLLDEVTSRTSRRVSCASLIEPMIGSALRSSRRLISLMLRNLALSGSAT